MLQERTSYTLLVTTNDVHTIKDRVICTVGTIDFQITKTLLMFISVVT